MHSKLATFGVLLLVAITILGAGSFSQASSNATSDGSTLQGNVGALDRAQAEFKRAIVAVRDAEAAGADEPRLKVLVEQLNVALQLIDRAEQLMVQGSTELAVVQAEQSIQVSTKVISDAVRLRDESAQRTYYGKIFTFVMVPVASLLATVLAHYGWVWWRRREVDRMMRMEIHGLEESKEEKQ